MKEYDLRKWHRSVGIILAIFLILQAGTGLFISIGEVPETSRNHVLTAYQEASTEHEEQEEGEAFWRTFLGFIHHGAGTFGDIYRIIVGFATLWMVFTGGTIFFKMRSRSQKRQAGSAD
jgi:hypothetical protein